MHDWSVRLACLGLILQTHTASRGHCDMLLATLLQDQLSNRNLTAATSKEWRFPLFLWQLESRYRDK